MSTESRNPLRPLLIAGCVIVVWAAIGLVIAAQTSLAARLAGTAVLFGSALHTSMLQTLTWIPSTLLIVAITLRWPVTRTHPARALIHIAAVPCVAFLSNVLLVLGFWYGQHSFKGFRTLAAQGAHWAFVYLHIALLVYLVVMGLTAAVVYYRASRARELHVARVEGQLAIARLQALNAQIRPHFLFNTLHTIGQMWRSGRSQEADAVLDHLGNLFHRVQAASSHIEVPLADELELVDQYLAIEQARFQDRLHTRIDASPEARACNVPPLLLQPIVENAVRHGISSLSSSGSIVVTANVVAGALIILVIDDGPDVDHATSMPGSGTGIRNTTARIAEMYGEAATLVIGDAEGGGTCVRISIPQNGRVLVHE